MAPELDKNPPASTCFITGDRQALLWSHTTFRWWLKKMRFLPMKLYQLPAELLEYLLIDNR
jgi:hypothetical protein